MDLLMAFFKNLHIPLGLSYNYHIGRPNAEFYIIRTINFQPPDIHTLRENPYNNEYDELLAGYSDVLNIRQDPMIP